jgi:GNAT superfamily N-acetyltransferase
MAIFARPVDVKEILPWRDLYRRQMNCQIVHDSLSSRPGWTQPYLLETDGIVAGYGSVLIGGPWTGTRTAFEFYLAQPWQDRAFDLFACFVKASQAQAMEIQTNDVLITAMFHLWTQDIASDRIVFEDKLTTHYAVEGAALVHLPDGEWALMVDGAQAARGGVLFHYNPPYGDVYMEVAEAFRRGGLGSYIVQELKRICYEMGSIPCARTSPENLASRKTLQKAGFVPCAHILTGKLREPT